jgi:uncharacterized membrane protein YfcA
MMLGLALGAMVGLVLGLLGGGGAILAVPLFVYVLGIDPKPAIAMSLGMVAVTSLAGAVEHGRAGRVRLRIAFIFGLAAMAGSFAGARAAGLIDAASQLTLFGLVMLAAAASLALQKGRGDEGREPTHGPRTSLLTTVACAVGALTGLVGVGGGFLIVPALVLIARLPMKDAVGTSLAVIAMSAGAGALGYVGRVDVAWAMVAAFTGAALVGLTAGVRLMPRVPAAALQRAFAVLLVLTGGFVLYQNRSAFVRTVSDRAQAPASTGVHP